MFRVRLQSRPRQFAQPRMNAGNRVEARADIVVQGDGLIVVIENKLDAGEQPEQCERLYWSWADVTRRDEMGVLDTDRSGTGHGGVRCGASGVADAELQRIFGLSSSASLDVRTGIGIDRPSHGRAVSSNFDEDASSDRPVRRVSGSSSTCETGRTSRLGLRSNPTSSRPRGSSWRAVEPRPGSRVARGRPKRPGGPARQRPVGADPARVTRLWPDSVGVTLEWHRNVDPHGAYPPKLGVVLVGRPTGLIARRERRIVESVDKAMLQRTWASRFRWRACGPSALASSAGADWWRGSRARWLASIVEKAVVLWPGAGARRSTRRWRLSEAISDG